MLPHQEAYISGASTSNAGLSSIVSSIVSICSVQLMSSCYLQDLLDALHVQLTAEWSVSRT